MFVLPCHFATQGSFCHLDDFPTLFSGRPYTLCCPAMSTECERVFSSTKKLITSERNALAKDIIEACECLKAWWKNSLIE
jgi:hAT family C-terminal dimerisation region